MRLGMQAVEGTRDSVEELVDLGTADNQGWRDSYQVADAANNHALFAGELGGAQAQKAGRGQRRFAGCGHEV